MTLSVSTAQPGRGLYVPKLEPVYLTEQRVERRLDMARRSAAGAPAAAPAMAKSGPRAARGGGRGGPPGRRARDGLGRAGPALRHVHGAAASRWTRRRAGAEDRAAALPAPGGARPVAAPRREAATFLTAKATNETGFPLLPGRRRHLRGGRVRGSRARPDDAAGRRDRARVRRGRSGRDRAQGARAEATPRRGSSRRTRSTATASASR